MGAAGHGPHGLVVGEIASDLYRPQFWDDNFYFSFPSFNKHFQNILSGDIASDLYGPQFWDDNFQFSFSVVVSCKSNKQLGYF